jgi:hypothetical protein
MENQINQTKSITERFAQIKITSFYVVVSIDPNNSSPHGVMICQCLAPQSSASRPHSQFQLPDTTNSSTS